jgi:hypothetical protein
MPYITSSIIMQLLTVVIPRLACVRLDLRRPHRLGHLARALRLGLRRTRQCEHPLRRVPRHLPGSD